MKRYVLILSMLLTGSAFAQKLATLDDTAKFLAGLPVKGPLEALTQSEPWKNHAASMERAWFKKEYFQLSRIHLWMTNNASEAYQSSNTAYYLFSGPDFLYAHAFFPNANTYILAGLEPVGQVPDLTRLSPEVLGGEFSALRSSMKTILNTHYFITKDMRTDLGRGSVAGTVPILYVFLARRGCTVLDTAYVNSPAPGVKITFVRPGGPKQTLYYFKTDLSGGKSPFLSWCAKQGPGQSLLKAASYLMHTGGFTGARDFLLEHSRVIIQDDSGIPLRSFGNKWKVNCHGRFVPHAEMFGKYDQPELAAVFARDPPPPELGFAFGYHWQIERGLLMMATRK
jgi:hypothetical protein